MPDSIEKTVTDYLRSLGVLPQNSKIVTRYYSDSGDFISSSESSSPDVPTEASSQITSLDLATPGASLADLTAFFARALNMPDLVNLIPGELSLSALRLPSFGVRRDLSKNNSPEPGAPTGFTFSLQWDRSWEMIPGMLSVTQPLVTIEVSLTPEKSVHGSLIALTAAGGIPFMVQIDLPSFRAQADLVAEEKPSLEPLLAKLGFDPGTFGSSIILNDASMLADFRGRRFVSHMEIEGDLTLGKLTLEKIAFDLMYAGGGGSGASGMIAAQMKLADIEISLRAERFPSAAGWEFRGAAATSKTVKTIANGIGTTFDLGPALGDSLPGGMGNDLTVKLLQFRVNTAEHSNHFAISGNWKLTDSLTAEIAFDVNVTRVAPQNYTKRFGGSIKLGGQEFDLIFQKSGRSGTPSASSAFLAHYGNPGGNKQSFDALIKSATGVDAKTNLFFKIKDALFANLSNATTPTKKKRLFAIDLDFGLDLSGLSGLPLIGKALPKDQALTLAFQPIWSTKNGIASAKLTSADLDTIRALLPEAADILPASVAGGLELVTTLKIGDFSKVIDFGMPSKPDAPNVKGKPGFPSRPKLGKFGTPNPSFPNPTVSTEHPQGEVPAPAAEVSASGVTPKWIDLQKNIGPLHFQRIGFAFKDGAIYLLLDANIALGPLTISLMGLGASYKLDTQDLKFTLDGLGVSFKRPPLELSGAFLRSGDDFAGKLILRTGKLSIGALGAYQEFHGDPSLFVYAFVDYPLGGPAFFFVEGLSAGFGMNRRLTVPPVDQIHKFPLVSEVIGGASSQPTLGGGVTDRAALNALAAEMSLLSKYIKPQTGQYFGCAGIRFTTFRILDSFALLAVSFGRHYEIDVFGVSRLKLPAESPRVLAEVDMEFSARFDPAEGSISLEAGLTPQSFILAPQCRLSGGYAFASWFLGEHAGEFVYSMGGYHPQYQIPEYYPKPPRVGFHWQINNELQIGGNCYYALTHAAAMAGGSFSATFRQGDLHAWFNFGADFLVMWKPFHYEASAYVEMGIEVTIHFFGTHHISLNAGAELSLWGPDFSGHAHVHVKVLGVKVEFSANFGGSSAKPQKLDWKEFRGSFFSLKPDPATAQKAKATLTDNDFSVISAKVSSGLIRAMKDEGGHEVWIVNPKELCLMTDSTIPTTGLEETTRALVPNAPTFAPFGIEPMGVTKEDFSSITSVSITEHGKSKPIANIRIEPIHKKTPAAMWSSTASPSSKSDINATMESRVTGFSIHPQNPPKAGTTSYVRAGDLAYEITQRELTATTSKVNYRPSDGTPLQDCITGSAVQRANTVATLGLDLAEEIKLGEDLSKAFVGQPRIVMHSN